MIKPIAHPDFILMKNSTRLSRFLLVAVLLIITSASYAYDVVVAKDGTGNYATVQAAIDAAPANSAVPYTIFIKNGKYREKITVPSNKPFLQLTGESVAGVFVYYDDPATVLGTQNSASFTINANDFTAVNITFANTFNYDSANAAGQQGLQAVAVLVNADRAAFKNCRFLGNQDTLYAKGSGTPRHYFKNCYIDGIIDFIFGSSVAVFDSCVIYAKARTASGSSYITAANTPGGQAYGYVFRDCKFPAHTGSTTYYFGRPWQNDGSSSPSAENKTAVLNSRLSDKIRPEGWSTWNASTNTSLIQYNEYNSQYFNGTLVDVSQRTPWSNQLSAVQAANYSNANMFGTWDPCAVLAGFCNSSSPNIAIANFKAAKGTTTSTFNWNISWPIDQVKYELFRSTTTRNGVYTKVNEVTATNDTLINFSLTDPNPPSGSIYYYYVLASRTGLASNYTDTVQISSAPTINISGTLSMFYQNVGSPSGTQTYVVSGTDLQSDVTITPPAQFEISNNGGTNWYTNASPLVLSPVAGLLANTTITVRLNAPAANTYTGNIVHTSTNAETKNVAANGTTVNAPAVTYVSVLHFPFTYTSQNSDSAGSRPTGVLPSTVTTNRIYNSGSISTTGALPAFSTPYGKAFFSSPTTEGSWSSGAGGNGGNLLPSVYQQFVIKADVGYRVRIDSIYLNAAFYATSSGTKFAIAYSYHGFAPSSQDPNSDSTGVTPNVYPYASGTLGGVALAQQNNGPAAATYNFKYAVNAANPLNGLTVSGDSTLTIRIYFSCSSSSGNRYGMLKDVIFRGLVNSLGTMPITLTSFDGSYNGNSVALNWNTVNEVGVKEFQVERSSNGREYQSIGKVAAAGPSSAKYSFVDAKPIEGANYYRLKIVDKDGSFSYSKVIVINTKPTSAISVYPNPAGETLTLTHTRAINKAVVEIYSVDGKRINTYHVQPSAIQSTIDVSELVKGTYMLIYSDGVNKTSSKFIKL